MLKAITLDYWDTLYLGVALPERITLRKAALRRLVAALGGEVEEAEFDRLYAASGAEAERWWREESRGYVAEDRIRWLLGRVGLTCAADEPELREAVRAVDDALLAHPPALVGGAVEAVRAFAAAGLRLAIVSDTGFASGAAQTRILERDGLVEHFGALVYSCDVGHAKPHAAPFRAALDALGVGPAETLHIGDIERTDVRGAVGAGLRAIRIDAVRRQDAATAAELAAPSWEAVVAHLAEELDRAGE